MNDIHPAPWSIWRFPHHAPRRILVRCRRISLEELRDNYDSELVNRQGGASALLGKSRGTGREQRVFVVSEVMGVPPVPIPSSHPF